MADELFARTAAKAIFQEYVPATRWLLRARLHTGRDYEQSSLAPLVPWGGHRNDFAPRPDSRDRSGLPSS